jgi:hypothetical protein
MGGKPRVLLIGGKPFNVPKEFEEHLDLIRHIEQDERHIAMLPKVDYIVVLSNWVNHSAVAACRKQLNEVPVVWVNKGWNAMYPEFLRRGIIKPEPVAVPAVQVVRAGAGVGYAEVPSEVQIIPPPDMAPIPKAEPEQPPTPLGERVVGDLWHVHVSVWSGKWAVALDRPAKEIIDCAVLEPKSADDFMNWLKVTPQQAKDIWGGYLKSRALFCRRNGIAYERRGKPHAARSKPVPGGMGDLAVMIERVTALTEQRGALGKERAALNERLSVLNEEFRKVDAEIEKLKPVLAAIDQLQRAVKAAGAKP